MSTTCKIFILFVKIVMRIFGNLHINQQRIINDRFVLTCLGYLNTSLACLEFYWCAQNSILSMSLRALAC